VRSASAAPPWASGVRPGSSARCGCLLPRVVPSRQTTRLHPMCKTSAEQLHRQREPQRTQKRHVVSGLTQRRGHLSEPSSGAHRLASIGYSPPCSSQHSVRLSTGARSCPSSRATPAAELCAPGARALGRQSSRHHRHDQREERRGQQEPHIALSAHLRTQHSPLTDDLRHPTSHLTGGARRLSGQDGSSAAVRQLTTSTGVLRHRPRRGWRLALSLRSPAPPSAGMLGWGGRGVAGGAGWPTAQPLATRLGWARGL